MQSRYVYRNVLQLFAAVHKVEFRQEIRLVVDVFGVEIAVGSLAEGNHLSRRAACVHRFHRVGVASVRDDHIGGLFAELREAELQILHRLEVVEVIAVDVQHYRDIREQLQERIHELARLADHILAPAGSAAAAYRFELTADYCGKVDARRKQDMRQHGGRGGLAVGAAHAERLAVPARD